MPAPTFAQPACSGIAAENVAAGTAIGAVSATAGPSVVYSITDGNQPGYYAIDPENGVVTTTAPLDHEAVQSSTLTITATDTTDNSTATANFAITVTGVDEPPTAGTSASLSVAENLAAGAEVGSVAASDPEGAAVTYALATADVPFAVSPGGAITTTAPLDFETRASYAVTVDATDAAGNTPRIGAPVNVTDVDEPSGPNPPKPPAPVTVDGSSASVQGVSNGFKAVGGELAYTSDGVTAAFPGVARATFKDGTLSSSAPAPWKRSSSACTSACSGARRTAAASPTEPSN